MKETTSKKMKEASVLLIAICMILSTVVVMANETNETNEVCLSNESITTESFQPEIPSTTNLVLWDQYDTDGSNGLSHMDVPTKRALLDDFEVPTDEEWTLTDFHSLNVWDIAQPGTGTDFHLEFWSDAAGSPGAPLVATTTVSYIETVTGRTWFSRAEFEIDYIYEPVVLTEGTYWIYGFVIGGGNNCFWMVRQDVIWGSECWCDYSDYPPMRPGSGIFGEAFDLAFQLTYVVETIPDLDCKGDISWEDVVPGDIVTDTFTVSNVGEAGSLLNWEIESYPDWGNWTFDPDSGTGLPDGDSVTINVEVVAPDNESTEFTGEIVLVNSDDPDDTCTIPITLITPYNNLDIGRVWLRGLLFRCNRVDDADRALAIRLHYIEFAPFDRTSGMVTMNRVIFNNPGAYGGRMYEVGFGMFTYVIGFFEGGLEIL